MRVFVNGKLREIAEGASIAGLLSELGVKPQHCAVERNLELVPRGLHADQLLESDDRIEVVTLVGGG